jgi:outer membrane receptor protein involved in Fe transport
MSEGELMKQKTFEGAFEIAMPAGRIGPHRVSRAWCGFAIGAVLLAANAVPAFADDNGQIQEIVVTAEKRAESVQNVPLAVSALTGDQLTQMGAVRFEDFALSAPSVSFIDEGPVHDKVVMRGISSGTSFDAQTPSTGYYIDDVPVSSTFTSGGTDLRLFDINHVEVLRGPQGTLYGAGAMGGAIRVITNQPDFTTFSALTEVTGAYIASKAGEADVNAMVNIPLIQDEAALRVVGTYRHQNGYIDAPMQGLKGINGGDVAGGRAVLKVTPSEDLTITLTGFYQHDVYDNPNFEDLTLNKKPLYGDLTVNSYLPVYEEALTSIGNIVVEYRMPWATLTSSSSFSHNTTDFVNDNTLSTGIEFNAALGLPAAAQAPYTSGNPENSTNSVEEFRLVSTETDPFKWIAGTYFQHQNLVVYRTDTFAPTSVPGSLGIVPINYFTDTRQTTYALFAEGTYDITPQWQATLGGRYTYVPTSFYAKVYGAAFGILNPADALVGNGSTPSSDFAPKFELTYLPTDHTLVYAEIAKGFRPGSANAPLPGVPSRLNPDTLWDYEIGTKTEWADGRLIANAAVYYIDWKGIQVVTSTLTFPNVPYLGNAGTAVSKGAELELKARPDNAWLFSLSAAYTDARFTETNATLNVTNGERIAVVPQFSGTFAVDYTHPLSASINGFAHFDVRYEGDASTGYALTDQGEYTSAYSIGDLRVGADFPSGIKASLFVNNLWDERAQLEIDTSGLCTAIPCAVFNPAVPAKLRALIAQPRTVGLTLSKKF